MTRTAPRRNRLTLLLLVAMALAFFAAIIVKVGLYGL